MAVGFYLRTRGADNPPTHAWGYSDAGADTDAFQIDAFDRFTMLQSFYITERAAANGPIATLGEFWVRNDVPNVPMFTDDLGTDFVLTAVPDPLTIGRAILTNTNDPDLVDTTVALNVGAADPDASQHLEFGNSDIQSKGSDTTTGPNGRQDSQQHEYRHHHPNRTAHGDHHFSYPFDMTDQGHRIRINTVRQTGATNTFHTHQRRVKLHP